MTFSIVAYEPEREEFGVAVCTGALFTGAVVPFLRRITGAAASQAEANPYLGVDAMTLLGKGARADQALSRVLHRDSGAARRQLVIIDKQGRTAAHTGAECEGEAGHVEGRCHAVAGNMLANDSVLRAVASAFVDQPDLPMARRLLAALKAGEMAGGDKRGSRSACIKVQGREFYNECDLRVDMHDQPLVKLDALVEAWHEPYLMKMRAKTWPRRYARSQVEGAES
ncbi:MAG: DUF1028 domain-containing protein [Alphaproteobacteria bacterium]